MIQQHTGDNIPIGVHRTVSDRLRYPLLSYQLFQRIHLLPNGTVQGRVPGVQADGVHAFLFSLGCYEGEPITVVARRRGGCVVSIKDGRYNIDQCLAAAISI